MGNDAPLACLSQKPRLLYEYFKQLFAQVLRTQTLHPKPELAAFRTCATLSKPQSPNVPKSQPCKPLILVQTLNPRH